MKESMIEKTLTSGRKVYIRKLSRKDIRACRDILVQRFYPDNTYVFENVNKHNDAWLQIGIGGLDGWKAKNGEMAPDEILNSLNDKEELELVKLVQKVQIVNPSKPSSSD